VGLDDCEHFALNKIKEHYRINSNAMAVRKAINHMYATIRDNGQTQKDPSGCGPHKQFDPAGAAIVDTLLVHARGANAGGRRK
jgi:hypothetical protein